MKRHCPRCGKPTAIVVTTKNHATRVGRVTEEQWRCEECFRDFKLHSPRWDALWLIFAIFMTAAGIAIAAGIVRTDPKETALLTLIVLGQGIAAGIYSVRLARVRKRVRPVAP